MALLSELIGGRKVFGRVFFNAFLDISLLPDLKICFEGDNDYFIVVTVSFPSILFSIYSSSFYERSYSSGYESLFPYDI
jgi:hypothetical protein